MALLDLQVKPPHADRYPDWVNINKIYIFIILIKLFLFDLFFSVKSTQRGFAVIATEKTRSVFKNLSWCKWAGREWADREWAGRKRAGRKKGQAAKKGRP
jgi:hypothetical protein